MLRYLIQGGGTAGIKDYIVSLLLALPIILFSLTLHECAHGYMAKRLGDPTASNLGRLTLNPIRHLDPIGFICMLLFGFGWAKPVPINTRYFKKPRRDMALTALAGPAANLMLAVVFALLWEICYALVKDTAFTSEGVYNFVVMLLSFLRLGSTLNVYLAVFNMLPIPPFDGSRIFFIFLPVKWYFAIMKYERWIMIGMLALLWLGWLTVPLSVVSGFIHEGIYWLLELLPFFG